MQLYKTGLMLGVAGLALLLLAGRGASTNVSGHAFPVPEQKAYEHFARAMENRQSNTINVGGTAYSVFDREQVIRCEYPCVERLYGRIITFDSRDARVLLPNPVQLSPFWRQNLHTLGVESHGYKLIFRRGHNNTIDSYELKERSDFCGNGWHPPYNEIDAALSIPARLSPEFFAALLNTPCSDRDEREFGSNACTADVLAGATAK